MLCGRDNDAVSAFRYAGRSCERTLVAGLELAGGRATRILAVLVVALFAYLNDAVTTRGCLTDAGLAGRACASGVLGQTVRRTTRAALMRSLIALFTLISLNDAVTAIRQLLAQAGCASPASLRLALRAATIAGARGIASFTRFDAAVAAAKERDALLVGQALVSLVLSFAVRRATRAALERPLIADFSRIDHAVAAGEAYDTGPASGRTGVIRFYLADAVASVAG